MSTSSTPPTNLRQDASVFPFRLEALAFLREGLAFTIDQVHGPTGKAHETIGRFLQARNLEWEDLAGLLDTGKLPPAVVSAIREIGGVEKLNRHVSGVDLCWGLRDMAHRKWGYMARSVLQRWGITRTLDFGRIVFAAIDAGLMQKQPSDTLDDFDGVYDFVTAFDAAYKIDLD